MSLARESQHIGLLPLFEEHPKTPALTVYGAASPPPRLHSRIHKSPPEHLCGEFGLGVHPHLLGYPSLLTPLAVIGPLLGQIQLPVDESLSSAGGVGQKHPNLAVLPLADGASVLALYPYASLSLLDEARLVDSQRTLIVC